MAKQGNLFALTAPDGTVGIFHQLGSTVPGRVCAQNCLVEKFGTNKVFPGKNITSRNGSIAINSNAASRGVGYFNTPDGIYIVERITTVDPRYNESAVISEYSEFFGKRVVRDVQLDTPRRVYNKQIKEHKSQQLAALDLIDKLISTLGYTKAAPNVVAFRHAAKRKK